MSEDQAAIYQLAYEEARRRIGEQVGELDGLRTRAGTLLAVVALATSFLGRAVLQDKPPHRWLSWAAIGTFLGAVVITLVLLLPRRRWVFGMSAIDIIEGYAEGEYPRDLATTHRWLALYLERREDENAGRLDLLYWLFTVASVLLGVEILLWLLALIWR